MTAKPSMGYGTTPAIPSTKRFENSSKNQEPDHEYPPYFYRTKTNAKGCKPHGLCDNGQILSQDTIPPSISQNGGRSKLPEKMWKLLERTKRRTEETLIYPMCISRDDDGMLKYTPSDVVRNKNQLQKYLESSPVSLSDNQEPFTQILILEGLSIWSMELLGEEYNIPHKVFTSTVDKGPIVFRNFDRNRFTFNMDQVNIYPDPKVAGSAGRRKRSLYFEALGKSAICFDRSALWLRKFESSSEHLGTIAIVICESGTGLGERLQKHYADNLFQRNRVHEDPYWLAWAMFHNLTDWSRVFEAVSRQLRLQQENSLNPEIELTRSLHNDTAVCIQLKEMLRVQGELFSRLSDYGANSYAKAHHGGSIYEGHGFIRRTREEQYANQEKILKPSKDACESFEEIAEILEKHRGFLDVTEKYIGNLINLVFNLLSVEESASIGRLTWITFIFLPLTFIASIFSMSIKELDSKKPSLWLYFAVAIPVLILVSFAAYFFSLWVKNRHYRRKNRQVARKRGVDETLPLLFAQDGGMDGAKNFKFSEFAGPGIGMRSSFDSERSYLEPSIPSNGGEEPLAKKRLHQFLNKNNKGWGSLSQGLTGPRASNRISEGDLEMQAGNISGTDGEHDTTNSSKQRSIDAQVENQTTHKIEPISATDLPRSLLQMIEIRNASKTKIDSMAISIEVLESFDLRHELCTEKVGREEKAAIIAIHQVLPIEDVEYLIEISAVLEKLLVIRLFSILSPSDIEVVTKTREYDMTLPKGMKFVNADSLKRCGIKTSQKPTFHIKGGLTPQELLQIIDQTVVTKKEEYRRQAPKFPNFTPASQKITQKLPLAKTLQKLTRTFATEYSALLSPPSSGSPIHSKGKSPTDESEPLSPEILVFEYQSTPYSRPSFTDLLVKWSAKTPPTNPSQNSFTPSLQPSEDDDYNYPQLEEPPGSIMVVEEVETQQKTYYVYVPRLKKPEQEEAKPIVYLSAPYRPRGMWHD